MKVGKSTIVIGAIFMALAVSFGAMGAHALKNILEPKYLETFMTGNRYHTYHAIGLILIGIVELFFNKSLKLSKYLMIGGVVFFSGSCYLYALTQVKTFAMIVPIGGVLFIASWIAFARGVVSVKLKTD